MSTKVVLLILDGWGNGKPYEGNAIQLAKTPAFDELKANYPYAELFTSGEHVGLPDGQMGNSEVGHLNIGAGRVVYQQLVLINKAFSDGSVKDLKVIKDAIEYAKANHKKIHLMGLLSDGGVHSSIEHAIRFANLFNDANIPYYFHAFTDGRDTDPKSGLQFLTRMNEVLTNTGGRLASVTGRYYAMDRDKRWERVKLAYDALVNGVGERTADVLQQVKVRYEQGETDEFLKPIVQTDSNGNPIAIIDDEDVVICFNFRTDRGREITEALTQQDFHEWNMYAKKLYYVTLTEYDKSFKNVKVVFPDLDLKMTLGEVLSNHDKKQVRIAETEKYPHVTFFFSGGRELPFEGETRWMAPSPKVATYDLQPEMNAAQVSAFTLTEIGKGEADFICVNFANPDMVGHTGVLSAEIKAIETVDSYLGEIVPAGLEQGYSFLITADHGNGEYMINESDHTPNTAHTTNQVPLILVTQNKSFKLKSGKLADLAPTILALMDIEQPQEMTGNNLLIS
ncbi:MAG: 2,3-bisphosphoglycerate-independent phosphoglycerate mutase [Bacteroidia bacterium]|jgi:2,3-bisphosphoglycerate-independent phosphoglycerate mutase|nr:2,3-bisphosphoglycerate-independent phosphoglycerate mutase [Bacteroidia bacterium]